jgi:hypothetical protein
MPPEIDNEVGYKKPPKHSQFKKGQSGNPRGQSRAARSSATVFREALGEKVAVTENGRRRKITKREAMFKQLVNRAAQGDPKATQTVLRLMEMLHRSGKTEKAPETRDAPRLRHVVILPDNHRDPRDPEEIAALVRAQDEYDARKYREREGQNPANENRNEAPNNRSSVG